LVIVVHYGHDCNCHATCRGRCTPLLPLLLQVLLPLPSSLHQVLLLRLPPYVHVVRPLEPHACTRLDAQRVDNGQSGKRLHKDEAMRGIGDARNCVRTRMGTSGRVSGHRRGV
jgi:hypothetical protein